MPWFSDRAGPADSSRITLPAVLPSTLWTVWAPRTGISRLNSPACTYPCQRFANALTDADA